MIPHASEHLSPSATLLSLCSRAREPQLLNPSAATTEANMPWSLCSETSHHSEKPTFHNQSNPHSPPLEKSLSSNEDPA